MIPSEVRSAEDLRRIVEERDTKNVTIAMADTNGLVAWQYISRDKLYSVLEGGWGMPPLVAGAGFRRCHHGGAGDRRRLGRLC